MGTTPKLFYINQKEFADIIGNVWEWAHDYYDINLKGGNNPQGPSNGTSRILRGGSWETYLATYYMRASTRNQFASGYGSGDVGFRLVRTLPKVKTNSQ